MYTLEMAIDRAKRLGLKIYTDKSHNKLGRRVFLVDSGTRDNLKHCVEHTPFGLICDCLSYLNRLMCAHIGCVVIKLRSLSPAERTELLRPKSVEFHVKKAVAAKRTTTIGASTEDALPAILMKGGRPW